MLFFKFQSKRLPSRAQLEIEVEPGLHSLEPEDADIFCGLPPSEKVLIDEKWLCVVQGGERKTGFFEGIPLAYLLLFLFPGQSIICVYEGQAHLVLRKTSGQLQALRMLKLPDLDPQKISLFLKSHCESWTHSEPGVVYGLSPLTKEVTHALNEGGLKWKDEGKSEAGVQADLKKTATLLLGQGFVPFSSAGKLERWLSLNFKGVAALLIGVLVLTGAWLYQSINDYARLSTQYQVGRKEVRHTWKEAFGIQAYQPKLAELYLKNRIRSLKKNGTYPSSLKTLTELAQYLPNAKELPLILSRIDLNGDTYTLRGYLDNKAGQGAPIAMQIEKALKRSDKLKSQVNFNKDLRHEGRILITIQGKEIP